MKTEKYRVTSHMYEGNFKYQIGLNKSMVHTGKHSGIEYGLNEYDLKERTGGFRYYFSRLWRALINKKEF